MGFLVDEVTLVRIFLLLVLLLYLSPFAFERRFLGPSSEMLPCHCHGPSRILLRALSVLSINAIPFVFNLSTIGGVQLYQFRASLNKTLFSRFFLL